MQVSHRNPEMPKRKTSDNSDGKNTLPSQLEEKQCMAPSSKRTRLKNKNPSTQPTDNSIYAMQQKLLNPSTTFPKEQ